MTRVEVVALDVDDWVSISKREVKYMKFKMSKTGLKLLIIYLVLVLLSILFLVITMETNAFSYLYLIILTFPWSEILAIVSIFYYGVGELSLLSKTVIFSVFVIANCIIIYSIGLRHDKKRS
jgi:hypothetical protein